MFVAQRLCGGGGGVGHTAVAAAAPCRAHLCACDRGAVSRAVLLSLAEQIDGAVVVLLRRVQRYCALLQYEIIVLPQTLQQATESVVGTARPTTAPRYTCRRAHYARCASCWDALAQPHRSRHGGNGTHISDFVADVLYSEVLVDKDRSKQRLLAVVVLVFVDDYATVVCQATTVSTRGRSRPRQSASCNQSAARRCVCLQDAQPAAWQELAEVPRRLASHLRRARWPAPRNLRTWQE